MGGVSQVAGWGGGGWDGDRRAYHFGGFGWVGRGIGCKGGGRTRGRVEVGLLRWVLASWMFKFGLIWKFAALLQVVWRCGASSPDQA